MPKAKERVRAMAMARGRPAPPPVEAASSSGSESASESSDDDDAFFFDDEVRRDGSAHESGKEEEEEEDGESSDEGSEDDDGEDESEGEEEEEAEGGRGAGEAGTSSGSDFELGLPKVEGGIFGGGERTGGVESGSAKRRRVLDVDSLPTFERLGIQPWLLEACTTMGIRIPTPVQAACVGPILAGRDVIGVAQTGSGKTVAFVLPILQRLARNPYGVFALVLTPTRELAHQISDQVRALGAPCGVRESVVVGGEDLTSQTLRLERRPHVVVATPGRLRDLIENMSLAGREGVSSARRIFGRTAFLVLDEADRLLEDSFASDLKAIIPILPPSRGRPTTADDGAGGGGPTSSSALLAVTRQTLLFSATLTPDLAELERIALEAPFRYEQFSDALRLPSGLKEFYVFVPAQVRDVYLYHLLAHHALEGPTDQAIVFLAKRDSVDEVTAMLRELEVGTPVALHSGLTQPRRLAAVEAFKAGRARILLATDVASRGLDIPSVELVINFDLPFVPEDYVHRVGRTARAGRAGRAVSVVTQHDIERIHAIEARTGSSLVEFQPKLNEDVVIKDMSRVYAARRKARMAAAEREAVGWAAPKGRSRGRGRGRGRGRDKGKRPTAE